MPLNEIAAWPRKGKRPAKRKGAKTIIADLLAAIAKIEEVRPHPMLPIGLRRELNIAADAGKKFIARKPAKRMAKSKATVKPALPPNKRAKVEFYKTAGATEIVLFKDREERTLFQAGLDAHGRLCVIAQCGALAVIPNADRSVSLMPLVDPVAVLCGTGTASGEPGGKIRPLKTRQRVKAVSEAKPMGVRP